MRKTMWLAIMLSTRLLRAEELETVGFSQALERAIQRSPSMAMAQADVHRAEALLAQTQSTYWPQLNLNATVTQLDADRKVGDRIFAPATSNNANVQLSVPILALSRRAQASRAEDSVAIAKASADDVRRQVAQATARAFVSVVTQHRLVEVSENAVRTAREHEAFARDRFSAGIGSEVDVWRAAQELAASESQLASANGALARGREALAVLLGADHPVDARDLPEMASPDQIGRALSETNDQRTDLAMARTRLKTSERGVRDGWMDRMPSLSLTAQPFFQDPATVTQPTWGAQAQLVLSLPLWDSGQRRGQQDERVAMAEMARAQLDQIERTATGEVRGAFVALRHGDDALMAARKASEAAGKMLSLAQAAFQAGAASGLEMVDSEQRKRAADTAMAFAEDQARQARIELLIACGRLP